MGLMQSCSWCHAFNQVLDQEEVFCVECGHRATRPRSACDCERCQNWRSANTADAVHTADSFTRVAGRGIKRPILSWSCSPTHAVLRVEDENNPELWLEVSLSTDAVVALMGGMMTAPCVMVKSPAKPDRSSKSS